MENKIGVGKFFFLNFFLNLRFHFSFLDIYFCPFLKYRIENLQKSLEKKVLLHKGGNNQEKY